MIVFVRVNRADIKPHFPSRNITKIIITKITNMKSEEELFKPPYNLQ